MIKIEGILKMQIDMIVKEYLSLKLKFHQALGVGLEQMVIHLNFLE